APASSTRPTSWPPSRTISPRPTRASGSSRAIATWCGSPRSTLRGRSRRRRPAPIRGGCEGSGFSPSEDLMKRGMIIGALLLLGGSLPAAAQQAETLGRWSVTVVKDNGHGEAISPAVLPGDREQTRLVLQCIPSPESKDLFLGVVVGVDMDFRTEGKG